MRIYWRCALRRSPRSHCTEWKVPGRGIVSWPRTWVTKHVEFWRIWVGWMSCLQENTPMTLFGLVSGEVTGWGHDSVCVSSRPRGSEMICLRERQTRFSSDILLAKAASCKDFGLLVVDISVAFMHARTDEEIYVKVPSGIKSWRFWQLKAAVNGTRKASKHWQEFSCDKLVTNMLFQQNDVNPCIFKRFCDNVDLEQHCDDFLVCGLTSNFEVLAEKFKSHFLVKKAEFVSLKLEHQNETHFLKRRIRVDDFG